MDIKQAFLLVSFVLLGRQTECSQHSAHGRPNALSASMTSSAVSDGGLTSSRQDANFRQRDVRSVAVASGGSGRAESEAADVSHPVTGLGWHLGGRPISSYGHDRRRRGVDEADGGHQPLSPAVGKHRLRKSSQPTFDELQQLWGHVADSAEGKQIKREWDDSVLAWIKRRDDHQTAPSEYFYGLQNGADGQYNPKSTNVNPKLSGMTFNEEEKRHWDENDLAWIKRNLKVNYADDKKRNWDDSVLTWIKKSASMPAEIGPHADVVDSGVKTVHGHLPRVVNDDVPSQRKMNSEKRMWDDQEFAWLKRNA